MAALGAAHPCVPSWHTVICIPHQVGLQMFFQVPVLPYPIKNMQVAIGQQWGNHTALRCPLAIALAATNSLLHSVFILSNHRGFEPLFDEV
jgi:hypothetical protein